MMKFLAVIVFLLNFQQFSGAEIDAFPGDRLPPYPQCNRPAAKFGSCPSSSNLINPSFYECDSDLKCDGLRLCCLSSNGNRLCSDPGRSKTNLQCEIPAGNTTSYKVTVTDARKCVSDINCGGDEKCCWLSDLCNTYCVNGTNSASACADTAELKKDGNCPSTLPDDAEKGCLKHSDCSGNLHCCADAAGDVCKKCTKPTFDNQGICPDPTTFTSDVFDHKCFSDSECNNSKKCCPLDTCNYYCVQPDHKKAKRSSDVQNEILSPFVCKPIDSLCPRKLTNPGAACTRSTDCEPLEKCCGDPDKQKFCHAPYGTKKGNCPAPNAGRKQRGSCRWDIDCPGKQKCCGGLGCLAYGCTDPE